MLTFAPEKETQADLCERHQRPSLRVVWVEFNGTLAEAHNALFPLDVAIIA